MESSSPYHICLRQTLQVHRSRAIYRLAGNFLSQQWLMPESESWNVRAAEVCCHHSILLFIWGNWVPEGGVWCVGVPLGQSPSTFSRCNGFECWMHHLLLSIQSVLLSNTNKRLIHFLFITNKCYEHPHTNPIHIRILWWEVSKIMWQKVVLWLFWLVLFFVFEAGFSV